MRKNYLKNGSFFPLRHPLGILALTAFLTQTGCLAGDPNPYQQGASTGGSGSGGSGAALRAGSPAGTPIVAGTVCSPSSTSVVNLTFESRLGSPLSVYWVGYSCEENFYATLGALGTYQVQSYAGHIFRLKDESGQLLYEYTATTDATQTIPLE